MPLTLAEFRGLVVRVNEQLLVVPTVNVERVVRVKKEAIKTVENRDTIQLNSQVISLVRLAEVLELGSKGRQSESGEYLPVLLLSLGGMRLAFLVDEIVGEHEQGQIEEATGYLKRALYLDPDFVLAHFALGNLTLRLGKTKESTRYFTNTLALLRKYRPEEVLPGSGGITASHLTEVVRPRVKELA